MGGSSQVNLEVLSNFCALSVSIDHFDQNFVNLLFTFIQNIKFSLLQRIVVCADLNLLVSYMKKYMLSIS